MASHHLIILHSGGGATHTRSIPLLDDFGASRPRWGSLQHSPDLLDGFKGPSCKGREGGEGKER